MPKGSASADSQSPARILAAASHDLRQPIQAIGLWVELLRMQTADQETRSILSKLQQTARGLESIVDSLLDISKLDMNAVEAKSVEFSIGVVLDHVAATFGPVARDHGLTLKVREAQALVISDPLLIERVLANFVSNAIHHCERGGVLVGCRKRGASLSVEVWDTGPGIPNARIHEIFEEFVQISAGSRNRTRGCGLGLSIARRIADLLGHQITVHSREGRGSCFRVALPLGRTPVNRQPTCSIDDDLRSPAYGAFVVFIEDEEELREAMGSLLRRWGCHAIVAASTEEAIAQLGEHLRLPDLIISDYKLANGESGIGAIKRIRSAIDYQADAVVMTGESSVLMDHALAASGIPILRKPVAPEVIREYVAKCSLHRSRFRH